MIMGWGFGVQDSGVSFKYLSCWVCGVRLKTNGSFSAGIWGLMRFTYMKLHGTLCRV